MKFRPLAIVGAVMIGAAANAEVTVWLDYSGFDTNLVSAWTSAGYTGGNALSAGEISTIRSGIESKLNSIFSGFLTTFTTTLPGSTHETLHLGASTGSGGLFGEAERIDWRNAHKDDEANIYVHNFDLVVMPGSFTRSQNLERITNAITGTSAHELGHNLGLQHFDAYGVNAVRAPGYGDINGEQNGSIMATGQSDLTLMQRGEMRAFNTWEKTKLEFADGMAAVQGLVEMEAPGDKNHFATAQALVGKELPISGNTAVNLVGELSSDGQNDLYSFEATMGSLISANLQSEILENVNRTDTVLRLLDSMGNELIWTDDLYFDGNSFQNGSGYYSRDSIFLNYEATYTGKYYLVVRAFSGSDLGRYDLLLTGLNAAPVPEPATMAALGLGLAAMARRRKSKRS